jgi:hypothetical protein
MEIAVVAFL